MLMLSKASLVLATIRLWIVCALFPINFASEREKRNSSRFNCKLLATSHFFDSYRGKILSTYVVQLYVEVVFPEVSFWEKIEAALSSLKKSCVILLLLLFYFIVERIASQETIILDMRIIYHK